MTPMLLYSLRLAWTSVRRTPFLSLLMVVAIALGVGVATAASTIHHVLARDPLPGRSDRLYYVRMDNWDPRSPHPYGIPRQISWRDMHEILRSPIPTHRAGSFQAQLVLYPESAGLRPSFERVRVTHADFFPMFGVPFRYGGPWERAADERPDPVVVISSELNQRLFGGADSVGRSLRLQDREFRVAGVLAPWRPRTRFYDLTGNTTARPEDVFLPFGWIEPMQIFPSGNSDGWKASAAKDFAGRLRDQEQVFIEYWVELPDARAVASYHAFLDAYTREQRRLGRFQRPLDNRVTSLPDLMDDFGVVPPQVKSLSTISVLFLAVAAVNLVGLFLGKFLGRAPVVGVRRALGASRGAIFLQHFVECELVALAGGAVGLALAVATLRLVNGLGLVGGRTPESFFVLDGWMVAAAIGLSLAAGAIAGLYPSWRICAVPPARHLKTQ